MVLRATRGLDGCGANELVQGLAAWHLPAVRFEPEMRNQRCSSVLEVGLNN